MLREDGVSTTVIGRRHGDTRVDLTRRETLAGLKAFDIIVNASDSVTAFPDALAEYCLESGKVLFETAAEPETYRRLPAARAGHPLGAVLGGRGVEW